MGRGEGEREGEEKDLVLSSSPGTYPVNKLAQQNQHGLLVTTSGVGVVGSEYGKEKGEGKREK